jgi:outer membrane biosynthesis protein TonB
VARPPKKLEGNEEVYNTNMLTNRLQAETRRGRATVVAVVLGILAVGAGLMLFSGEAKKRASITPVAETPAPASPAPPPPPPQPAVQPEEKPVVKEEPAPAKTKKVVKKKKKKSKKKR